MFAKRPRMGEEKKYRIGEAAEILKLKPYVLRFWESEFSQLQPIRTEKGQRLYTTKHIELLRRIQNLLHERGLTIDGARKELSNIPDSNDAPAADYSDVVAELETMREILLSVEKA